MVNLNNNLVTMKDYSMLFSFTMHIEKILAINEKIYLLNIIRLI